MKEEGRMDEGWLEATPEVPVPKAYAAELPRLALKVTRHLGSFELSTVHLEVTGLDTAEAKEGMAYLLREAERLR